jgi:hypothetical protein
MPWKRRMSDCTICSAVIPEKSPETVKVAVFCGASPAIIPSETVPPPKLLPVRSARSKELAKFCAPACAPTSLASVKLALVLEISVKFGRLPGRLKPMAVIEPVVEVLFTVKVNWLPLSEKLVTLAVTPKPPVNVIVSACATELRAINTMAAAVVSKALRII